MSGDGDNGKVVFEIDEGAPIMVELVAAPGQAVPMALTTPQDLAKVSDEAMQSAMNTIHQMARRLTTATKDLAIPPSKVELEFGLKLTGETGALIAKAGGEAALKVKLTWEKEKK